MPTKLAVRESVDASDCCPSVLTAPLATSDAEDLARGFHALGDPVRLKVLSMLAAASNGEICVCEFIEPLGKSQGTVSHHLRILADAELVRAERRGKWVWYSLDRQQLARLRRTLEPESPARRRSTTTP